MSRPVAVRNIIIEISMQNLSILRDALFCYRKYLKDVQQYEHDIPLTKSAIKRRVKYLEDFINALELDDVENSELH